MEFYGEAVKEREDAGEANERTETIKRHMTIPRYTASVLRLGLGPVETVGANFALAPYRARPSSKIILQCKLEESRVWSIRAKRPCGCDETAAAIDRQRGRSAVSGCVEDIKRIHAELQVLLLEGTKFLEQGEIRIIVSRPIGLESGGTEIADCA